jgi:hypothetical protein
VPRTSTVTALADAARSPKRRGTLIAISRSLPVPMLFGLRLVARRPRRAVLSAACIAVTIMGIVAVLAFHADVNSKLSAATSLTAGGLSDPVVSRDEQMLTVITVMLVTLAALTVIFTAWATVLDARHASALIRALGATPRQVRAGLAAAQVLSALPGAIVGIRSASACSRSRPGAGLSRQHCGWSPRYWEPISAAAGMTPYPPGIRALKIPGRLSGRAGRCPQR